MRHELEKEIFLLLPSVQQQNRFAARAHDTNLSLAESHLLVEIDLNRGTTARELVRIIGIEKSLLSRILSGLERKNMIRRCEATKDRRTKALELTARGKEVLSEFDVNANRSISALAVRLSQDSQQQFLRFIARFSDCLGVTPALARPSDHPFRPEIRRLTRAFSLLGRTVFGVRGFTSLEWHLLLALLEASIPLRAADLAERYSVPANTISAALHNLARRGLISRERQECDRRVFLLAITEAGKKALKTIETAACARIADGLEGFSDQEAMDYARLFRELSGGEVKEEVLRPRLSVRSLREQDRPAARAMLIEALVHSKRHLQAPERLVAADNRVFVLFAEQDPKGVCEFALEQKGWTLLNFAVAPEHAANLSLAHDFLFRAVKLCLGSDRGIPVIIRAAAVPAEIYSKLPDSGGKREIMMRAAP